MLNKLRGLVKGIKQKKREVEARKSRERLGNIPVIAVTGSCGKTSTTHFLGHILSEQGHCNIGIDQNLKRSVIKTLFSSTSDYRYVVQEVSGDRPGRLSETLAILRPQIGIVTTVGSDHYTNFRSLESTALEKGTLPELLPENGAAVLNADDPHVLSMADRTKAKVITYGLSNVADVVGSDICFTWPEGLSFTVTYKGESRRVEARLFGKLWVSSLLAAISAALAAGIDLDRCCDSLHSVSAYNRRMSIHQTEAGAWFINDSYKAPYWSVSEVIQTLKDVDAPRKTLILGSFSDNPGSSSKKYRTLAREGLEVADRVIVVGKNSNYVAKIITTELKDRLFIEESIEQVLSLLLKTATEREVILLKSNSREHLERLIYGQSHPLDCWRQTCGYGKDCAFCPEGRLFASATFKEKFPPR